MEKKEAMESSNCTQSSPGISHLEEEGQACLCIWLGSPRNTKASVLVQAHLCLYRTRLTWFQLPCLEAHLTNPFTSGFVLLPSFPVLILMFRNLSLHTFHSAKDANFLHPFIGFPHQHIPAVQYRNASPDVPRLAAPLPALLQIHLLEAFRKAACQ